MRSETRPCPCRGDASVIDSVIMTAALLLLLHLLRVLERVVIAVVVCPDHGHGVARIVVKDAVLIAVDVEQLLRAERAAIVRISSPVLH